MNEKRGALKFIIGKSTGKGPLGRPMRTREENIRIKL